MNLRNTMLILIVSMMTACQHERPESPPEKKGSLPEDFFLVGDYVCYKRYDINTATNVYYTNIDSLTLSISPVENGYSELTWKRKDTVLHNIIISDYGIPNAYDVYQYPIAQTSFIKCTNSSGLQLAAFKCWPSYINYGYITDSIIDVSAIFGYGSANLYRMP